MNHEIDLNEDNPVQQEQKDKDTDLDLFAEELPDQTDLATPNFCTAGSFGTASCFGGSAATGSSISSAC